MERLGGGSTLDYQIRRASWRHARPPFSIWAIYAAVALALAFSTSSARAQTALSGKSEVTPEVREKLSKKYSIDLRDATLLDALFAVRDASGLNIVVGNEVTGTVNASFADTTVYDILDSLLITRGYGYRVVGGSLAVVPLEAIGDQLPLFETEIIGLKHSVPDDLLTSIESMLSPEGRAHAVASSNSIVLIDYPQRITRIRQHVDTLEKAAEDYRRSQETPTLSEQLNQTPDENQNEDVVRVFPTQYVTATILAEAITPLLSESGQASPVEHENKLVVADTREHVGRIELALAELDRPRPQVRIRALIYDCSTEDLERLGVNWSSGLNGRGLIAATGAATQAVAIESTTEPIATGANGLLRLTSLNRYMTMESVIQALNTAGDSRLLADPNVVVMNHETAEIKIVTEVPYQQLTQGLEGGTIGTTEFREAGVTLNVIPHIADDNTLSIVVNPQFSLLTGFSEPDNAPIIDRRETSTTVRVTNNQTIVLGGLRQRTRISEQSRIPFLGEIPHFGKLFRHRSDSTRESELLVFITPEIVTDGCDCEAREQCFNQFLEGEIEATPTSPRPFGMETLRIEHEARVKELNRLKCHHFNGLHDHHHTTTTTQACQTFEVPWPQAFEVENQLIDVGLSDVDAE